MNGDWDSAGWLKDVEKSVEEEYPSLSLLAALTASRLENENLKRDCQFWMRQCEPQEKFGKGIRGALAVSAALNAITALYLIFR